MADELDVPTSEESLYLARGDEVSSFRPFMQGDVFQGVVVPGLLDDTAGNVLILTHPCSMRRGPHLTERLLVARVRPSTPVPLDDWRSGHFRRMPLPDLDGHGSHFAAEFEEVGAIQSDVLANDSRKACLDPYGIGLLQQRFVHYLTRVVVPLSKLALVCDPIFAEADHLEEWIEASVAANVEVGTAEEQFDSFIRDTARPGGVSLQDDLRDPLKRAAVARAVRERIEAGL